MFGIFGEDSSDKCRHEREDIWPSEDEYIWYLVNTQPISVPYWVEKDAVYVELRPVEKELVCTGCGERRYIETAEQLGGPDHIKVKEEMSDDERAHFVHQSIGGGWTNRHSMKDNEITHRFDVPNDLESLSQIAREEDPDWPPDGEYEDIEINPKYYKSRHARAAHGISESWRDDRD